jgi:hypothetical protein
MKKRPGKMVSIIAKATDCRLLWQWYPARIMDEDMEQSRGEYHHE